MGHLVGIDFEITVLKNCHKSSSFSFYFSLAKSCARLFIHGRRLDGFYNLHKPDIAQLRRKQNYIRVWCDMHRPNDGWILFYERCNASFNFFRNWVSYENGFGKPGFDFWIGNINMHALTLNGRHVVRIELLTYFDKNKRPLFAEYDDFKVLSPSTDYTLQVGKFRGSFSSIFSNVNNSAFSTWDRDNDKTYKECAKRRKGAWWYGKSCVVHDPNTMLGLFIPLTMKVKEILGGNVFPKLWMSPKGARCIRIGKTEDSNQSSMKNLVVSL